MRVCIATGIYPPSIGGPATYSKLLFDELPKKGIEVKVLSYDSVRHLPKGISHFVYFFKLLKETRDCDIIYAQDLVSVGYPAMFAARILNKKFVIKIVGDYAWEQGVSRFGVTDLLDDFVKDGNYYNSKVSQLKSIQRKVAKSADKIIVPSRYLKKIVTKWGVGEDNISVIYNSFEVETTENKKETKSLKLVSVGRLVPWKGFDVLIDVVEELKQKYSNIKLEIIGDGPDKEKLQQLSSDKKLEDTIFLLGKLDKQETHEHISSADAFILNTKYEGLSHVILEALALGTPVITTDVCGNPEVIEDNENGILVEPDDKSAIKEAVDRIYEDPDFREKLIKNGESKLKDFDKENMLKELVQELNSVL